MLKVIGFVSMVADAFHASSKQILNTILILSQVRVYASPPVQLKQLRGLLVNLNHMAYRNAKQ